MTIQWTKIKRDVNGNTRFVCHFLNLNTEQEKECTVSRYAAACQRANKLGGRKFNNKQYGGGIVFQAYQCELVNLESRIKDLLK